MTGPIPPFRPKLDRVGGLFIRLDRRRRSLFPDGWGDEALIDRIMAFQDETLSVPRVEIVWGRKEEHHGARVRRGTYTSPLGPLLPLESRAGMVELWSPPAGDGRVAVALPAWNDEGFVTRRRLARMAAVAGVSSMLIEAPLYGTRRRASAPPQPIRTVSDFMLLGYSVVAEAVTLVRCAASLGVPGLTGYSMGGSLAALASSLAPTPVATAPFAASATPEAVVFEGMIGYGVEWREFEGEEDRLRTVLDSASVLHRPGRLHHQTAILVGATADGFVPPGATAAIANHWGAELRWIDAGHGTLLARHKEDLVAALVESFERFETISG